MISMSEAVLMSPGISKLALSKLALAKPASGKPASPQGCTSSQLRKLTRRVSQHYDLEMSKIGLKTTQYSLLSHLAKMQPIRPGDLAIAMAMEPSTLTRNLKPLVTAGWVELANGSDGRSRSVTLTDAGRDKRAEAQRRWKAAQIGLNQTLGLDRVAALHALIQESLELLAQPSAKPGNSNSNSNSNSNANVHV